MKKWRGVGLIAIGFLIGIGVSFAPELQAASSKLLGSSVGNVLQVKLDGKNIGEGGVISGTTYVPLRTVANNLGAEVVRVNKNEVVLSSGPDGTNVNMDKINVQREALITEIRDLNLAAERAREVIANKDRSLKTIDRLEVTIEGTKKFIAIEGSGYDQSIIDGYELQIKEIEDRIKTAEIDLPVYEKKIADLEAQLSKLK
ncbi:hypothetical protein [Paenibacillus sp. PDC88]|uniref:hypothetical protein n=1 Tax=Paenibacillus sp. PDC88 TaxID=1884375 RepID=UPI000894906F|nr:hypothetical protein [Paenibacillus sp. PDC88]SDW30405.1 Copper amine oxidase N-terminal domain-containing protein [Paenibacillus sp. PDC88]